jgi:hypothetical protein
MRHAMLCYGRLRWALGVPPGTGMGSDSEKVVRLGTPGGC